MTEALPLLVFDVNETLLDLDSLAPLFARLFGARAVLREWFAQMILYSGALTLAGDYADFGALGAAVLRMVAATHGTTVGDDDVSALKKAVAAMPAHPDVPAALTSLRAAGFRLFTLTNNPRATCEAQLQAAGLAEFFERNFSIDDQARRYKPAPEAYGAVSGVLGGGHTRFCLVACHTWDVLGARAAGWDAALVLRAGNATLDMGGQPQVVGADLRQVAERLIARYKGSRDFAPNSAGASRLDTSPL